MPRPIIGTNAARTDIAVPLTATAPAGASSMTKEQAHKRLRARRSPGYVQAMLRLDSGGHVSDPVRLKELISAIRDELPEVSIIYHPLGIVSRCYLGPPYEVHTLDVEGGIIEHYWSGRRLPDLLERARSLACHEAYQFIEVYADCLRAVSADGAVSFVEG
jgi:hypothetical protein